METTRRSFMRGIGATIGAASVSPGVVGAKELGPRWAMVVDVRKCIGCQACTVACEMENDVPGDQFRTIVSTYEVREGDAVHGYMLPRLCNQCNDPPCVPVCPVQATWQREDGVVVIDNTRCVGCAYCVQACPYDARFINPKTQTADKCTFCIHRVEAGLLPACVETCVGGARIFGDLNDADSAVGRLVRDNEVKVLRPEMETDPHVFYIGLDPAFQGKVGGAGTLWRLKGHEEGAEDELEGEAA